MNFLKKLVPWIGAAATGNVPALITMAAQSVGSVLGKEVKPDLDSITAAVNGATPDQILALKQEDNNFKAKMQAMGFEHETDIEKIEAEDRASARSREIAIRDTTPKYLAYITLVGVIGMIWLVISGHSPALKDVTTAALVGSLVGQLIGELKAVYAYYFGSSASSDRKTELLAQAPAIGK